MAVKHSAEVTVYDVSDAYSVTLTNEAATFKATSDTKLNVASTATTRPQAFMGTDAVACSVVAADCVCSDTANVSVSVNSSGDNATWPLVTISVGANATAGGTVEIPVVIGSGDDAVTIEKVFSYSIALKGTKGSTGTRGALWYSGDKITGTSTTATIFSDSGISSAIVGDMYLNTETGNTYRCTTAGAASAAKWVYVENLVGPQGATGGTGAAGADGGRWYTGTGITGTSTTATVFSGSGVSSAVVGDMYMNTSTSNYYRCTVAGAASVAKWVYAGSSKGLKGDAGDDPYTLSLTSDNGNVFRNSTGTTTYTAHVYQAGAELSTMPSGHSVKWYVDDTLAETDTSLPAQYTVSASNVDGKAVVRAEFGD